jgi:hypothetical protein
MICSKDFPGVPKMSANVDTFEVKQRHAEVIGGDAEPRRWALRAWLAFKHMSVDFD